MTKAEAQRVLTEMLADIERWVARNRADAEASFAAGAHAHARARAETLMAETHEARAKALDMALVALSEVSDG